METISRIEAVEMSLVTANKEKLTLMDSAERHLSISVQVHNMRKVSSQQHINRAARSINQDMMLVNDLQERSDGLKVMSRLSLLKSGHTMKALRQVEEPCCIYTLSVLLREYSHLLSICFLHLRLLAHHLPGVLMDLLILNHELSLELADLGLELLEHDGLTEPLPPHINAIDAHRLLLPCRLASILPLKLIQIDTQLPAKSTEVHGLLT